MIKQNARCPWPPCAHRYYVPVHVNMYRHHTSTLMNNNEEKEVQEEEENLTAVACLYVLS